MGTMLPVMEARKKTEKLEVIWREAGRTPKENFQDIVQKLYSHVLIQSWACT